MNAKNLPGENGSGGVPRSMMSVGDVADDIGCSTRHIRRLADSGRMPRPIRLGSLVRWPRTSIQQWIADGCPSHRNGGKR
jgi:excisionase family DNA binding protein